MWSKDMDKYGTRDRNAAAASGKSPPRRTAGTTGTTLSGAATTAASRLGAAGAGRSPGRLSRVEETKEPIKDGESSGDSEYDDIDDAGHR